MVAIERHASYRPLYQAMQPNTIRLLRIIPQAVSGEPLYQLLETPLPSMARAKPQSEHEATTSDETPQTYHKYSYAALVVTDHNSHDETTDTVRIPVLSGGGGEHIIEVERGVHKALEQLVLEQTTHTSTGRGADGSGSEELYVWTEGICVDQASAEDVAAQGELVEELVRQAGRIVVWNGSRLQRVVFEQ